VTRVGIVGGGLMGLATAYRLAQAGVQVDVMDRADGHGGLMSSYDFDGHPVDRFYHVVLPTDDRVLGLAEELGLRDRFRFSPVGVGFWDRDRLFSISSTKEFLRFPLLSPLQRLRLGAFVVRCNRRKDHDDLDGLPLLPWLEKQCGKGVVDRLWRPLLDSKFDGRYDDLPATYMWARTRRMAGTRDGAGREIMGTLDGGYQRLIDALADRIRNLGGSIETGMTVTDVEPADGGGATLRAGGESRRYDLVFSTLLPEQGRRILGAEYAAAAPADHCRYLGVLCLIVRTRESVSPYYTLSLTDRSVGLTTVVETTHVTDPATVGGHLLYVTKYVDPSSDLLTADPADVERTFLEQARRILPQLDDAAVLGTTLQRARAVEPVHLVGGASRLPSMFPAPGLAMASSAHVYPEVVNGQAVLGVVEKAAAGILARLADLDAPERDLLLEAM
jgi:protoporphyrinogen oxidase